jgi:hypothetical protein
MEEHKTSFVRKNRENGNSGKNLDSMRLLAFCKREQPISESGIGNGQAPIHHSSVGLDLG